MFCVKWGDISSTFFNVTNGVRQGSILSPYLFAVYVDDLSEILNSCNVGTYMNNQPMNHIFYADDLCLVAPSPSGLQSLLNICCDYAKLNDITYNSRKSMCMMFKPARYRLLRPDITLDGSVMEYCESGKYLGVMLNVDCKDDDDIQKHLRSFYARSNTIMRKFYKCSTDVKLSLFQCFCLPSYCVHLWFRFTKAKYRKLCVAFNNVYRRILGFRLYDSASFMYANYNIDNFDTFVRKLIYNFMNRLYTVNNNIVQSVLHVCRFIPGGLWQHWMNSLYTNNPTS